MLRSVPVYCHVVWLKRPKEYSVNFDASAEAELLYQSIPSASSVLSFAILRSPVLSSVVLCGLVLSLFVIPL